MNFSIIEARDLSEAWFLCIRKVIAEGREYIIERGSNAGQKRKELDYVVIKIKNPGILPLVPDVPQGVPAPSSMKYVENYLPYLMTSHKEELEQYTYGEFLENQIAEIIKMYKEDGYNTNQACMVIGNKESIYLSDPPCLRMIDTRVRDNTLHFIAYFRSWDLWAGFPSNLAAIQLLKEYIAEEIGVDDGEIIVSSKGLHLYDYTWELAKQTAKMI